MVTLISRPITVRWDEPPDVVAASINEAIAEPRYEDAGHEGWSYWRVTGAVDGASVDVVFQTHDQPGWAGASSIRPAGAFPPDGG